MPVVKLGPGALSKAIQSGGGAQFGVPREWMQGAYGSGFPVQPVSMPQDIDIPREFDYPLAVNSTITPRTGYGLTPFSTLKEVYENVSECRIPVSLIYRELSSFTPALVDEDGNKVDDHPYQWMVDTPDGETPFGVFMTRFLKSTKVYDAPALYLQQRSDGSVEAMHYIDGSTLFLIVTDKGNTPSFSPRKDTPKAEKLDKYAERLRGTVDPTVFNKFLTTWLAASNASKGPKPEYVPAYAQIIKGTPFSWWNADQIWYKPQSRRMDSPYGESFIEAAWPWIMIIVNIVAFELGHYKTGNMPEGFVTLPQQMFSTMDRVLLAETMFNARMGSNPATERMRLRMFPDGTKYFPTKKADFPGQLYKQAFDIILHSIGVPPSELGDVPGQGLGGKGFKEGAVSDLGRNILYPTRDFMVAPFNDVLRRDGVTDVHMTLDYPMDETDPDKQKQGVYDGMAHGTLTLNDALSQLGMNPVGDPDDTGNIANKHLIVAGQSIYVVEDMQLSETGLAVPNFSSADTNQTGGAPVGPETAAKQAGAEHTPEDNATLIAAIKHMIEGSTLTGKTHSVPSGKTFASNGGASKAATIAKDGPGRLISTDDLKLAADKAATKCFDCALPPTKDVLWAEGHGRCWFCDKHFDAWKADGHADDIVWVHEVENGKVDLTKHIPVDAVTDMIEQHYDDLVAGVPEGHPEAEVHTEHSSSTSTPTTIKKGDNRPGAPDNVVENLVEAGAIASDILGLWQNVGTGQLWVSIGDWAEDSTVAAIRSVLGSNTLIEAEASPPNAGEWIALTKLNMRQPGQPLDKHCGVCPEDDEYFGAPVSREAQFTFPNTNHVNGVEIIAMIPDGLPAKAALWKPEGGESDYLQEYIGGPQFVREEAAYLLDRALGFMLVPVAYVAEANEEQGAAVYYTHGLQAPYGEVSEYAPEWVARAAVLDYIASQQDRGYKHNYGTHPDDPTRPILFDNGLAFPESPELHCQSPFCDAMLNVQLPDDCLRAIKMLLVDAAAWQDIERLIGSAATQHARECAQRLLDNGMITHSDVSTTENESLTTGKTDDSSS